jgi:bilirubin oxidase
MKDGMMAHSAYEGKRALHLARIQAATSANFAAPDCEIRTSALEREPKVAHYDAFFPGTIVVSFCLMHQRFLATIALGFLGTTAIACGGGTNETGSSSSSSSSSSSGAGGAGGEAGAGGNGGNSSSSSSSSSSSGSMGGAYNKLWIPPTIEGKQFNLKLSKSTKQLRDGTITSTMGYNGAEFWGPTLIMQKGDVVQMNVTNDIGEDTTTHWHGFHIPANTDGGPHQIIPAGTTWSPSFEVKNQAATYWYHPHLHMMTQSQLTYGAGGLIIIRDPQEAALALPRTYGTDDIPLVLTSRRFNTTNQFNVTDAYGDYELVNGTPSPEVDAPAQFVRFRILNGEIERGYNLGFSDDRQFYVIGSDGGLLNAPVPTTRLVMFVGERYEILVDMSKDAVGSSIDLKAYNSGQAMDFPGGEPAQTGKFGSLLNNKNFDVLHINVTAPTANPIMSVPQTLASNVYWTDADATSSRTLSINDMGPGTPFTFDGQVYDMNVINQNVALNAIDKWTIKNGMTFSHSFHIHDIQFKLTARTGGTIAAYEQGWKDTVRVPRNGSVTFVAKFDDFASATDPFMYHCHMVDHEDGGLMGQFLVK